MSETREQGMYWVQHWGKDPQEPALWSPTLGWRFASGKAVYSDDDLTRIGPRVQTPAEIAAAIAAARAEGVAIGAHAMRDRCARDVHGQGHEGLATALRYIEVKELALPPDADAILRAERQKGVEAAIAAFKLAEVWKADDGLPSIDVVADRVRLLVTP